jgi:hypothetical protein
LPHGAGAAHSGFAPHTMPVAPHCGEVGQCGGLWPPRNGGFVLCGEVGRCGGLWSPRNGGFVLCGEVGRCGGLWAPRNGGFVLCGEVGRCGRLWSPRNGGAGRHRRLWLSRAAPRGLPIAPHPDSFRKFRKWGNATLGRGVACVTAWDAFGALGGGVSGLTVRRWAPSRWGGAHASG